MNGRRRDRRGRLRQPHFIGRETGTPGGREAAAAANIGNGVETQTFHCRRGKFELMARRGAIEERGAELVCEVERIFFQRLGENNFVAFYRIGFIRIS